MLNIGIVGVGHLGRIHAEILQKSDFFNLIGVFDINQETSIKLSKRLSIKNFTNFNQLLKECDVVDIVTPTNNHFNYARQALKKGKHIFIEKPITKKTEEALELIKLSKKSNSKIQIGYIERFNPAFVSVKNQINHPVFFETHRLNTFNKRGTDVSVILDLMIHDIDILLHIVNSKIKNINANGISIISKSPDIANARIEFENGCVANLTASRISMKKMRKTRVFQKDAYISIDFLNKKSEVVKITEKNSLNPFKPSIEINGTKKQINIKKPKIKNTNALEDELISFSKCINNNLNPNVSVYDGYESLKVAYNILHIINNNS